MARFRTRQFQVLLEVVPVLDTYSYAEYRRCTFLFRQIPFGSSDLQVERSFPLFAERAQLLKQKLGPILVQLPPHLVKNMGVFPYCCFAIRVLFLIKQRAEKLQALEDIFPRSMQFAFEFRHESWLCDEVYAVLRRNNWSLVLVSHPKIPYTEVRLLLLLLLPPFSLS